MFIILTNYVKIYQLFVLNNKNTHLMANQRLEQAKVYSIMYAYIIIFA